jgi:hypothetical protein
MRLSTVDSRISQVLFQMFQNGLEKHKLCFCAVAVVVQLQLLECPTWQTDYAVGVY